MRYLIGIAIGLAIIFNWSSIKSYFDKSIVEQAGSSQIQAGQLSEAPKELPKGQLDAPVQKQDMFKDFK